MPSGSVHMPILGETQVPVFDGTFDGTIRTYEGEFTRFEFHRIASAYMQLKDEPQTAETVLVPYVFDFKKGAYYNKIW